MICIIQLKSSIKRSNKLKAYLITLGLGRVNNAIFVENEKLVNIRKHLGNVISFGEVSLEVFSKVFCNMLQKHSEKIIKSANDSKIEITTLEELSILIFKDLTLFKILNIKKTFCLHPPRKGLVSLKDKFKGELGYNDNMEKLLNKMLL